MSKPLVQALSERKFVLGNQYAFLAEIEELYELKNARKASECPYSYEDEIDRFNRPISRFDSIDASPVNLTKTASSAPKFAARTDIAIQQLARDIHVQIWENRANLFPHFKSMSPVEMLDPVVALEMLGYRVETVGALGQLYEMGRNNSKIAGLIDRSSRRVELSSGLPTATRSFTAAHELGHALMHDLAGMHRDDPTDGSVVSNDPMEREANKFAAYFLLPEKLLRSTFEGIFGKTPFGLSEETRFALSGSIPHSNWRPKDLREFSRLIASTPRFNGSNIISLMDQFRVSKEAMAIRLEQLGFVTLK